MKAAVITSLNSLEIKEVSVPKISKGSILIKVHTCAICGSDIRIFKTGNSRVKYPAIIGHEISGEVVEVGADIIKYKVGDKIAVGADVPCGNCNWCLNGMGNCCDINYAMGYQFDGGFAEYCLLNETVVNFGPVNLIPEGVSMESAALAEPLACCINGMDRVFFSAGKSVLIIGSGPIGLLLSDVARAFGASLVILSDIDSKRLEFAKQFNLDYIIDSRVEDLQKKAMEITAGMGIDVIFTACPVPDVQEMVIKLAAKRGFINYFSGLAGNARNITISSNDIHYKELYITGSHGSTPMHHMMALKLISMNRINVSKLISHRYKLNDILFAFETVEKRIGLKVLISP